MNIERLYILPEGSNEARVYEWKENHLTFEELIAFIASRNKMPNMTKWISDESSQTLQI